MNRRAELLGELAKEICWYSGGYEDIVDVYNSIEELIESSGKTGEEIVRATFFGDIQSWNDDYFYIDAYGNFSSCCEKTHEDNILSQEEEIISDFIEIFKDNLEDFREQLEELGIDIDNLD
jgi:hypothetical protein|nr:MAG TPA: hypothetical protein [Ackermannviridae sp.]